MHSDGWRGIRILTTEQIAEEWTRQTISTDADVVRTVAKMLMQSWPAYEHYTGPLGMQTLTDITGSHYGPNIESSENNGWGQWHRADHEGVGMDRSVATGTGFAGQYPPEVAKMYETAATTPDNLLLFFHHVPYTYKLDQQGSGARPSSSTSTTATTRAQKKQRSLPMSGPRSRERSIRSSMRICALGWNTRRATPSCGATPSCSIS